MLTPRIHINGRDPLEFLLSVMENQDLDVNLRVRAAIAACQYVHTKTHDGGKKEGKQRAADVAASGKFTAQVAPRLIVDQ